MTQTLPSSARKADVVAAAVQTLQARGYTVILANEQIGTVTTDWREVTGLAQWLGTPPRKRVMVSTSPDGRSVNVQISLQSRANGEYRNARPGRKEKEEAQSILREITEFLGTASPVFSVPLEKPPFLE